MRDVEIGMLGSGFEDGLAVNSIIDAACRSMRSGRRELVEAAAAPAMVAGR